MESIHSKEAQARWATFSIFEQMGNAGSEVHRTMTAQRRGDERSRALAFDRALELLNWTMQDPRWSVHRKREIGRARESFCDAMNGGSAYGTDFDSLDRYFTQFGIAARADR